MDVTLIGRNVEITDRFRSYVEEKAERVEHLADRALALEVRLCRHHETNGTAGDDRVEMTLIGPGPVVRAEASGIDKFAAFDVSLNKLMERIRRAKDRKKVHRGHGNRLESLHDASTQAFAAHGVVPADAALLRQAEATDEAVEQLAEERREEATSPVVIRRKQFPAEALTVEEAVDRMELVGHDFFLFIDVATGEPSVVYRRVGWNYGVIALDGREEVSGRVLATSGAASA
jgi:ribosomal subunit interface protein